MGLKRFWEASFAFISFHDIVKVVRAQKIFFYPIFKKCTKLPSINFSNEGKMILCIFLKMGRKYSMRCNHIYFMISISLIIESKESFSWNRSGVGINSNETLKSTGVHCGPQLARLLQVFVHQKISYVIIFQPNWKWWSRIDNSNFCHDIFLEIGKSD